jgi:hypothetical protein
MSNTRTVPSRLQVAKQWPSEGMKSTPHTSARCPPCDWTLCDGDLKSHTLAVLSTEQLTNTFLSPGLRLMNMASAVCSAKVEMGLAWAMSQWMQVESPDEVMISCSDRNRQHDRKPSCDAISIEWLG